MSEQTTSQRNAFQHARSVIMKYRGPGLRIMEVCGTHTHEIFKLGIRQLLPPEVELISGPGCPVCVTPATFIDEALFLSAERHATLCTFGDLMRVPGSRGSLAQARGKGANIRIVYTPLDSLRYAREHPEEEIVFLSVGFETTTPASCLAVKHAKEGGLGNFSLLTANKTMDAAYLSMAKSAHAYLYPGHVCAITGTAFLRELAERGISGVVAGFTAAEILTALSVIIAKREKGQPFFANCYPRVVSEEGNPAARRLVREFMEPCDARWRGLGTMKNSGMVLKDAFSAFDARKKFDLPKMEEKENPSCRCGEVLQGKCRPAGCPLFSKACTPDHPIGACMVSQEGTCSAYYQYGGLL